MALALFAATALFVWWRNSEIGVLVDISYVVNTATRIALGDVPYLDFPLAQAPGEFLVQASLIKIFGAQYAAQVAYAVLIGGAGTALTYLVARRLLSAAPAGTILALVFTLSLVPLGVYSIYPHPFYDSDACVLVVAGIGATLAALERPSWTRAALAGVLIALPLVWKQNIGGAYLAAVAVSLALEARKPSARRAVARIAGCIAVTLGVVIVALQLVVGIDRYLTWAWTFALAGRGVTFDRIVTFALPIAVAAAVWLVLRRAAAPRRVGLIAAALGVVLAAYVAAPVPLLFTPGFFPPVVVLSCALAFERMRRDGASFERAIPFIALATTLGVLQSQGLGASSFGIFPFLVLAIACAARDALALVPDRTAVVTRVAAGLALLLVLSGSLYTLSNVRLGFVDVNAPGPVVRSTFPSLNGLAARGPYVNDLDAILVWTRDHIAPGEGFVFLPGEDPVFFALDRKPALPSVYFYDVATPYTPQETAAIADRVGLRWVIVKDHLQLAETPPLEGPLVDALTAHATLVDRVGPYRIYRR